MDSYSVDNERALTTLFETLPTGLGAWGGIPFPGSTPPSLSLGRADWAPPRTPTHKRETRSARDISPHDRPPEGPAPLQNRLRKAGGEIHLSV